MSHNQEINLKKKTIQKGHKQHPNNKLRSRKWRQIILEKFKEPKKSTGKQSNTTMT